MDDFHLAPHAHSTDRDADLLVHFPPGLGIIPPPELPLVRITSRRQTRGE